MNDNEAASNTHAGSDKIKGVIVAKNVVEIEKGIGGYPKHLHYDKSGKVIEIEDVDDAKDKRGGLVSDVNAMKFSDANEHDGEGTFGGEGNADGDDEALGEFGRTESIRDKESSSAAFERLDSLNGTIGHSKSGNREHRPDAVKRVRHGEKTSATSDFNSFSDMNMSTGKVNKGMGGKGDAGGFGLGGGAASKVAGGGGRQGSLLGSMLANAGLNGNAKNPISSVFGGGQKDQSNLQLRANEIEAEQEARDEADRKQRQKQQHKHKHKSLDPDLDDDDDDMDGLDMCASRPMKKLPLYKLDKSGTSSSKNNGGSASGPGAGGSGGGNGSSSSSSSQPSGNNKPNASKSTTKSGGRSKSTGAGGAGPGDDDDDDSSDDGKRGNGGSGGGDKVPRAPKYRSDEYKRGWNDGAHLCTSIHKSEMHDMEKNLNDLTIVNNSNDAEANRLRMLTHQQEIELSRAKTELRTQKGRATRYKNKSDKLQDEVAGSKFY